MPEHAKRAETLRSRSGRCCTAKSRTSIESCSAIENDVVHVLHIWHARRRPLLKP